MAKPFSDYVWSYSSATSCSLQLLWKRRRVQPSARRANSEESESIRAMGSAMHDFARLSMLTLMKTGQWPRADKVAAAVLKSGDGRELDGDQMAFMRGPGYRIIAHRIDEIIESGMLFFERFRFNVDDMIGIEKSFGVGPDGKPCGYKQTPPGGIRGRIDWVELSAPKDGIASKLRVIDFKNRPAIHADEELRSNEQLSIYAYAMASHYSRSLDSPSSQGIYYLRIGAQKEVSVPWELTTRNVERLMAKIRFKSGLEEKEIKPEPGIGKCQYCEYLVDCPEGRRLIDSEGGVPRSPDTAKDLAKSLFVVSELQGAAMEGLKEYCKENGPVQIDNGTVYGFRLKETRTANIAKVLDAARASGLDVNDLLSINMKSLKSKMKQHEDFADLIEKTGAIEKSTATEFSSYNPETTNFMTPDDMKERKRKTSKVVLKKSRGKE